MTHTSRIRVASIVASAARRSSVGSVYDFAGGGYRMTSAKVDKSGIHGYDYGSGTFFTSGGRSGEDLSFFDYETGSHVSLQFDGSKFAGFDYHSGQHFSGTARGGSISLYDYETAQYYSFSA